MAFRSQRTPIGAAFPEKPLRLRMGSCHFLVHFGSPSNTFLANGKFLPFKETAHFAILASKPGECAAWFYRSVTMLWASKFQDSSFVFSLGSVIASNLVYLPDHTFANDVAPLQFSTIIKIRRGRRF
jgi:hypothetical protein